MLPNASSCARGCTSRTRSRRNCCIASLRRYSASVARNGARNTGIARASSAACRSYEHGTVDGPGQLCAPAGACGAGGLALDALGALGVRMCCIGASRAAAGDGGRMRRAARQTRTSRVGGYGGVYGYGTEQSYASRSAFLSWSRSAAETLGQRRSAPSSSGPCPGRTARRAGSRAGRRAPGARRRRRARAHAAPSRPRRRAVSPRRCGAQPWLAGGGCAGSAAHSPAW